MWNDNILWRFSQDSILTCFETAFLQEPLLAILDTYGWHKQLVEFGRLTAYKVFQIIVPDQLIRVVHPLDVGINCSFQQLWFPMWCISCNSVWQCMDANYHRESQSSKLLWVIWMGTKVGGEHGQCSYEGHICHMHNLFIMDSINKSHWRSFWKPEEFSIESWVESHAKLLTTKQDTKVYGLPVWHLSNLTRSTKKWVINYMRTHPNLIGITYNDFCTNMGD